MENGTVEGGDAGAGAARAATFAAEGRPERALSQGDGRALVQLPERLAQGDGRGRLAFTEGRRGHGGDQDVLALWASLAGLEDVEANLGGVVTVGLEVFHGEVEHGGNIRNRLNLVSHQSRLEK